MTPEEERKLVSELKTHQFKEYNINNFKRFMLKDEEWPVSKRRGPTNKIFITVFSSFRKRLLARTFYMEEGYERRKRYCFVNEVKRQLAGCSKIVTKRLYAGMGIKVWKYEDEFGWQIHSYKSFAIDMIGRSSIDIYEFANYNDYRGILSRSVHKYSAYEHVKSREYQGIDGMFYYLMRYEKNNDVEMLTKMGLEHLIKETKYMKKSKKGLKKIGVTKGELKYLQSGISLVDYRKVQDITVKMHLTEEECKKAIVFVERKITPTKRMLEYVVQNNISTYDYIDYIKNIDELGYQMRASTLYPKEFVKAHDDSTKKMNVKRSEILTKKIASYAKDLEKLNYEDSGLIIRAVLSQQELIDESKKLEHCVKTYDKRVADRETAIFLIRKEEHDQEPYVTLELKQKKIIQCRAFRNRVPEQEVIDFVNKWASKNKLTSCFGVA